MKRAPYLVSFFALGVCLLLWSANTPALAGFVQVASDAPTMAATSAAAPHRYETTRG
jgi:hypothetical protein